MKICSTHNGVRLEVSKDYFLCPVCKNDDLVSYVNEQSSNAANSFPNRYDSLIESVKNIKFLERWDNEKINEHISQMGMGLIEIKLGTLAESINDYGIWVQKKNDEKSIFQDNLAKIKKDNDEIIIKKNKEILQKEEEQEETESKLFFSKLQEKDSINNLKYFLNLIEYIQKEKNIDIEQIKKQLKEKKQNYPYFSNLQALYYVALDNEIIFFKKWIRLPSKYDDKCYECNEKISVDEDIFWNKPTSQVKHFDCKTLIQQKNKISKLSESANNYFMRGEHDEAMKILNQIKKIKFLSIFRNSDLSKKLEPVLQNDIDFLKFVKSLDDSELMSSAKSIEFEDFLKGYRIKFIEKCNLEIHEDITKEFEYILEFKPEKKGIFENLVREEYEKYNKNLTYFLNSHEENSEVFQKIVKSCGKHGFFVDPYMDSRIIDYFNKNFPEDSEMTELHLLTAIDAFNSKFFHKKMKESIERFKEFLKGKEIKLEVRVIHGKKLLGDHGRYFYGDNIYLEIPDGMDRFFKIAEIGQVTGKVIGIDPKIREKNREIIEKRYDSESCIDFLENYETMQRELPEKKIDKDREMFDAKCGDCGNDCKVPFKPDGVRPVYCQECFQNHR
jgi:CxxC-x17-CxxC domain-containing protein